MSVVLILTDQQRRDLLGSYGNPWTRTPTLDRLAAGGLCLDRTYVARHSKDTRHVTGEEEVTDLALDPEERCSRAADPTRVEEVHALRVQLLDVLLSTQSKTPEQISHA